MVNYNKISNRYQPELYVYRNSDKTIYFQVVDSSDEVIDITSFTGNLVVFLEQEGTNTTIFTKAISIVSAVEGKFSVSLTETETDIDYLPYKYYIELIDGTNNYKYGNGEFVITGDDIDPIAKIRKKYNFRFSYDIMKNAYDWAKKQVLDKVYMDTTIDNTKTDENNVIEIENYVADKNFDEVINEDDIRVYQYMNKSPYTVQELNGNISSITFGHPSGKTYIVMDSSYPSTDYKLSIDYKKIIRDFSDAQYDIRRVIELYFIKYLFESLSPFKLQQGMTEKTLNGQTIRFDQNAIQNYLKDLDRQILELTINIKGIGDVDDFTSVQLSKEYKY